MTPQQQILPPNTFSRLRELFDREDTWQAIGLLAMMATGAFLEMLAVSMMFPLIETLANPKADPSMPIAVAISQLIGPSRHDTFPLWLLAFLVVFYVVKNLFFSLLFYVQNRFGFQKQEKLSFKLFAHYLELPYAFHLERNTADLLRNLTHETDQIVWSVMVPGLTLITESFVALGLAILLFYSSFQPALVISSVFGVAGFLYYQFFRDSLERWGSARMRHDGLRIRAIHEGLGGLKELKVLGRGQFFLDIYAKHNRHRGQLATRHNLVLNSNLLLLEVLGISSLLILVGLHLAEGKPFSTILPMMGVFAGAAFRLIPATNRIINSFQQIRYAGPVVHLLCDELASAGSNETKSSHAINFQRDISLNHVSFSYGPNKPDVLRDITLTIYRGEMIGFVGASGAGKTTLIDILLGVLQPTSGRILIDGEDIAPSLAGWQHMIGYVPQNIFLIDGTVRQNVAFAVPEKAIDDERVWAALNDARLADYIRSLPFGIDTPIGELGKQLSGGQRQRVGIARALYHNPLVLVLDEATSSLDSDTETEVIDSIRHIRRLKTVLIITHRPNTLDCCDKIYRLEHGELVLTDSGLNARRAGEINGSY